MIDQYIDMIKQAIKDKQIVKICYSTGHDAHLNRLVIPVTDTLAERGEKSFFKAWCINRFAYRTFRLDRIEYMEIVGPGTIPEQPKKGDPNAGDINTPTQESSGGEGGSNQPAQV